MFGISHDMLNYMLCIQCKHQKINHNSIKNNVKESVMTFARENTLFGYKKNHPILPIKISLQTFFVLDHIIFFLPDCMLVL